jgi:SAM-dependent methyltransferase
MPGRPDESQRVVGLYQRHAQAWAKDRENGLFEKSWLDRFLAHAAPGPVLDIGCGSGEPIARYLVASGRAVTGADSSSAMIAMCRSRLPRQEWIVADMRELSLDREFAGLIAWDSFFHLKPDDQRRMFPIFRRHAASGAALMFTSGPREGTAMGVYGGEPLYHASLAPEEYRGLLGDGGFRVIAHVAEDPACGGRTVWLAQRG